MAGTPLFTRICVVCLFRIWMYTRFNFLVACAAWVTVWWVTQTNRSIAEEEEVKVMRTVTHEEARLERYRLAELNGEVVDLTQ